MTPLEALEAAFPIAECDLKELTRPVPHYVPASGPSNFSHIGTVDVTVPNPRRGIPFLL